MSEEITVDERGVRTKPGRKHGLWTDVLHQCQKCPRWVYTIHEHNGRYLCGTCASQEINKEIETKWRAR